MLTYCITALLAFIGGALQAIAGFGCGIVMMLGFPYLFGLVRGAGISSAASMFLNYTLVIKRWKDVDWKKIIVPIIVYVPCSTVLIHYVKVLPQQLLKYLFAAFMLFLAAYYLIPRKKKPSTHLSVPVKIFFLIMAGVCSALFGIGGPFIILYFMSIIEEPKKYMATTQGFFAVTGTYNTIMRIVNGILTWEELPFILCAGVAIAIGGILGSKIMDKIDPAKLKKITYIMVGVAGITNLF